MAYNFFNKEEDSSFIEPQTEELVGAQRSPGLTGSKGNFGLGF